MRAQCVRFAGCAAKGFLWLALVPLTSLAVDNYEPNDNVGSAYNLQPYPGDWLHSLSGDGLIFNDSDTDTFKLSATSNGWSRIQLELVVRNDPVHSQWVSWHLRNASGLYWKDLGSVSNGTTRSFDLLVMTNDTLYLGCSLDPILSSGSEQIGYTFYWNALEGSTNDPCEWNDSEAAAVDLTPHRGTNVSEVFGASPLLGKSGTSPDLDYFRFDPPAAGTHIRVEMPWDNTRGSLSLLGYQPDGAWTNAATYFKGISYLDTELASTDTVVLNISGNQWGTPYDLQWRVVDEAFADDALEDNDSLASATDTSTWGVNDVQAQTGTTPLQYDSDWYRIEISSPELFVCATAEFSHALGDMDLVLYDSSGAVLSSSTSTSDTEEVCYTVDAEGSYYLRIYGEGRGNAYSLNWSTHPPPPDLYVNGVTTNELSGTLDGRLTAGDTIQLNPSVRNAGAQPGMASNVVGTLISSSAWITVTQPTGIYSNIPAQLSRNAYSNGIPEFSISNACPGGLEVDLEYRIAADNASTVTQFLPVAIRAIEDAYEQNDTADQGAALNEDTLLTGTQGDEDWYTIALTEPGWVSVTCSFQHVYGNLNLGLYDAQTNLLSTVDGSSNSESLSYLLYPGTYALRVDGPDRFSSYQLRWQRTDAQGPELELISHAVVEDAGPRADDDGNADPGETVTLSFALENTGELRATNVTLRLTGGDTLVVPAAPASITGGTVQAGASVTWTGLAVSVDWTASDGSFHGLECIAEDDSNAWTNSWNLEVNGYQDDAYEYDSLYTLAHTSLPEKVWLSAVNGFGRQVDDDYAQIRTSNPTNRMYRVRMSNPDLYLRLHDLSDVHLGGVHSTTTNRVIEYGRMDDDPLLIKVLGGAVNPNTGQAYDLYWEPLPYYADVSSHSVREVSGNENGLFEPGETVSISVTLTNQSSLAYPEIPVSLISTSGLLTITTENPMGVGPFTGSGIASNFLGFYVEIATNITANSTYDLTVNSDQSNGVVVTHTVPLTISAGEDDYEPNNAYDEAYALPVNTALSSISGPGVQGDEDWYRFSITQDFQYITATCSFTHAEGDIDLSIFAWPETLYTVSSNGTGQEVVQARMPQGTHHLRVSGANQRNEYDLYYSISNGIPPQITVLEYGIEQEVDGPYFAADNDGTIDPGEKIFLWASVTNSGDLTMHTAGESLESSDSRVHFTPLQNPLGAVPGRTGVSNHFGMGFWLDPDFPVGGTVPIDMVFRDINGLSWTQSVDLLVQGISDDAYEMNPPTNFFADTLLSTIDGIGIQRDLDLYAVPLFDLGYQHDFHWFTAWCSFTNSGVEVVVNGVTGTPTVAGARVDAVVGDSSTVIHVQGNNAGKPYDLRWQACPYTFQIEGGTDVIREWVYQDGILSAGETGTLDFAIHNLSCTNYGETVGVLTTEDPYLELIVATNRFPAMSAGGFATNDSSFIFSFAPGTPMPHTALVGATVSGTVGSVQQRAFSIVAEAQGPEFAVPGLRIDDDNDGNSRGNDNGLIEPHEDIELTLCLTNVGGQVAQGVEVAVTSTTSSVVFPWHWRWYEDIGASGSSCTAPDGSFLFGLGATGATQMHFEIEVSFDGGTNRFDVYRPIHQPMPAQFARPGLTLDDDMNAPSEGNGDGILDPGESIQLQLCLTNIGDGVAMDIEAALSSTNPTASVIWSPRYIDDINGGDTACPTNEIAVFLFELDPGHPTTQPVQLQIDLSYNDTQNQSFIYSIPVSSLPPPNPVALEISGPAVAPELANTYGYVARLRFEDSSSSNVSDVATWTNTHPLVEIFSDETSVHLVPGIIFSNENTILSVAYDGWETHQAVLLTDQPYPLADFDFQNATPGAPPNGWTALAGSPGVWSVAAETNLSPTNLCVELIAGSDGLSPVQVAHSAFIPAYLYLRIWIDQSDELPGGADDAVRTSVSFSPDSTGLSFRRPLFSIQNDGTLLEMNGFSIGTVPTEQGFYLDLLYLRMETNVVVSYWYDGERLGPSVQPQLSPLQEENLTHVLIGSDRGTTRFDNLVFAVDPFPSIVEASVIEGVQFSPEGFTFDWTGIPAVRYITEVMDPAGGTNWESMVTNAMQGIGGISVTNPPTHQSQWMRLKMLIR